MADLIKGLGGEAGFGENTYAFGSAAPSYIDLKSIFPNGLNFFGYVYSGVKINDGGVTFANGPNDFQNKAFISAFSMYYEDPVLGPQTPTPGGTSTGSNAIYWDIDPVKKSLTITWDDISGQNAYQLRIVDKSALGKPGDFDIVLRYEAINLAEYYQPAGDYIDYGYAGFRSTNGAHSIDLPGSGTTGAGDPIALMNLPNASNIGRPGIFVYEVRQDNLATISAKLHTKCRRSRATSFRTLNPTHSKAWRRAPAKAPKSPSP